LDHDWFSKSLGHPKGAVICTETDRLYVSSVPSNVFFFFFVLLFFYLSIEWRQFADLVAKGFFEQEKKPLHELEHLRTRERNSSRHTKQKQAEMAQKRQDEVSRFL
jgi:hypothetical protein